LSPHGSRHRKLVVPAHASAGNASAAISAIHFSFISSSSSGRALRAARLF